MKSLGTCVIFNKHAARRRALGSLETLRQQLGPDTVFRFTEYAGHGEQLAREAAHEGFGVVVAAGGDGTVHEVANGLVRAGRPDVFFAVLPIGSANDYAYSLDREKWVVSSEGNLQTLHADVGRVEDPAGKSRFFFNSLGLGLNGAVTLESRRINNLRGPALYGLATLRALSHHYTCPVMDFLLDGQSWQAPTLLLSVAIARREGGFVLAPEAAMTDGWFDYLHAGRLSRWEIVRFLPRLALKGPPRDHPKVRIGRCRSIHLRSPSALTIHIDGEFFSRPEDGIRDIRISLLPGALPICRLPASTN